MVEDNKNLENQDEIFHNPSREQIAQLQDLSIPDNIEQTDTIEELEDASAISIEDVISTLSKEEQVNLNEKHLFADGMYCRHGIMPKGSIIVGHRHKKTAINVLASGSMLIKLNMEDEWEKVEAPFVNSTEGGLRKIIYTLEDCFFMNIFRTDETELDNLYEECVYKEDGSKPHLEAEEIKKRKLLCG